jgi:aryl-alcohol dehydrogenase-like predicted oxidoreductase
MVCPDCFAAPRQRFTAQESMPQGKLPQVRLGTTGPEVPRIGLGCMSLSGVYGRSDDEAGARLIRHAVETGISFLDSAYFYGWGHNEELIGRALKGIRNQVVLATKFGIERTATGLDIIGRPEYVQRACEASLKRLGVDVIDLYYQHRIDRTVPIEDTAGAMARLVEQGKVRYLGLCEARPETIRRAHRVHPLAAVQTEYSLLYRTEAEETLVTTRELGIAFVAYSPLGRSLLTGSIHAHSDVAGDRRADYPRFAAENLTRNLKLVDRIETIAKEKACTPAQLALAWLLAQGADVVPIPGTKKRERLDENIGALKVSLSQADLDRISSAMPPGEVAGLRYPEPLMKTVYQ